MCFFKNPKITFGHFSHYLLTIYLLIYYFRVLILLMYIESRYLVLEEKRRDIVSGFLWCVVPCAIFRISSRYLVFLYI